MVHSVGVIDKVDRNINALKYIDIDIIVKLCLALARHFPDNSYYLFHGDHVLECIWLGLSPISWQETELSV